MSIAAQDLQRQMETPIWPHYKVEEEGTKITFSSYVRREIEGTMYKTLTKLQFTLSEENNKRITIEQLTIRFHDYCYKVLILGKPNKQWVDTDTRNEILRLAQELIY